MKADTCSLKCPLRGLLSPNLEQGVESIDQIASLCQSDVEAVRVAARETTLSFGEVQRAVLPNVGRGWGCQGPWRGCAGEAMVSYPKTQTRTQDRHRQRPASPRWAGQVSFMVEVARGALLTSQPAPFMIRGDEGQM